MNEQEWLECTNPTELLDHVRLHGSERKLRLFPCACCRRIWPLLVDVAFRNVVEATERFADGLATQAECSQASNRASSLAGEWGMGPGLLPFLNAAGRFAGLACAWTGLPGEELNAGAMARKAEIEFAQEQEKAYPHLSAWAVEVVTNADHWSADYFRDIFGNPFRPVAVDPVWLTWRDGTIPHLAQTIYDERRFADMPVLADALEDAGCTNADILQHCRQAGEHVRGGWVMDLLLGKT
jgi:hypothetical protein